MTEPEQDREAMHRYLTENPAMTERDWKGKGFDRYHPFEKDYVSPLERPWHELGKDEVRKAATSTKARYLSKGERQAAARDPGLIWDERTREYRLRDAATPAPQEATSEGDSREGASKVPDHSARRPAGPRNSLSSACFCTIIERI